MRMLPFRAVLAASALLLAVPTAAFADDPASTTPASTSEVAVATTDVNDAAAVAEGAHADAESTGALQQARDRFYTYSGQVYTYSVRTKQQAWAYNLRSAETANNQTATALSRANSAYTTYRRLAINAGRWPSIQQAVTKKHDGNQFLAAVARGSYKTMASDAYFAAWVANDAFRAQGKSTQFASETAIDVLRAISMHHAAPKDWAFLPSLYRRIALESSGNRFAQNPTSSAYGRFQFLNATWATVGGYKTSDGVLQSVFGLRYIAQRYGHPNNVPTSGSY